MNNRLYYGDNLDVLRNRKDFPDGSIDLIYLDPPFNSNANYNILFKSPAGKAADSQIEAFDDTWHWNDKAEAAFHDVMTSGNTDVAELLRAMRGFLKENDMMAYLAMMAVRLIELHRVLKPTGSLYLHCDPTASHYLKLLLDGVFGLSQFRSEIIWKRSHAHNSAKRWGPIHDTIFFYSKSDDYLWRNVRQEYDQSYVDKYFKFDDDDGRGVYWTGDLTGAGERNGPSGEPWRGFDVRSKGRHWAYAPDELERLDADSRIFWPKTEGAMPKLKRYLNEAKGIPAQDVLTDVPSLQKMSAASKERLGYPTQKPLALLERIINASSNPGDIVLDPFCGCGTAVDAAQKLGRRWIGIDVTHLSIGLIERRLQDRYGPNLLAKAPGKNPPLPGEGDRREAGVEGASMTGADAPPPSAVPAATSPSGGGLCYEVIGTPNDLDSALKLAAEEPHQFQYWITQAIGGQPYQGGRKGADRGIDGYIYYSSTTEMDTKAGPKQRTDAAIISVKAGQRVGVAMVRDLKGVMEREKADIGIFVCVINPTREMEREAASAGVYTDPGTSRTYPRLQLYTLAEYFAGLRPKVPMLDRQAGFKKAGREDRMAGRQSSML